MPCTTCHGGQKFGKTRAEAHEGMNPLPSSSTRTADAKDSVCTPCHQKEINNFMNTLHADTRGISDPENALVLARAGSDHAKIQEGLAKNCNTCHVAGCGDCHVTRPQANDGGFTKGHVFTASPSSNNNCMGCHGSRIQKEYTGTGMSEKTLLNADVHWNPNGMQCVDCHEYAWMHEGEKHNERYEVAGAPTCEQCHETNAAFMSIEMHKTHASPESVAYLQCQVCHAQDYNNCTSCHVALNDEGVGYFSTEKSWMDFKIGKNVFKSDKKPWDYVVVRHVPVAEDTFEFYGEGLLPNIEAKPTYLYATPHTINKITRQTKDGCNSCHGNPDVFLMNSDLQGLTEAEIKANKDVVLDATPTVR